MFQLDTFRLFSFFFTEADACHITHKSPPMWVIKKPTERLPWKQQYKESVKLGLKNIALGYRNTVIPVISQCLSELKAAFWKLATSFFWKYKAKETKQNEQPTLFNISYPNWGQMGRVHSAWLSIRCALRRVLVFCSSASTTCHQGFSKSVAVRLLGTASMADTKTWITAKLAQVFSS